MAKTAKTGRAAKQAGTRPVKTRDERDLDPEKDTRTASEKRRDEKDASKERARRTEEGADSGDGEEVDNEQLPLNHQTLMDHRDVGLPPEATPREGRTSPFPPLSPALKGPQTSDGESIPEPKRMVQATALGYYADIRRRPGDVFAIREEYEDAEGNTINEFSKRWMRDAPRGATQRITTANQAIAQENRRTRELRAGGFPTSPGSLPPHNTAPTYSGGVDQRPEDNPLED